MFVLAGCSEFPCLDEATIHVIPPIEFSYGDRVRYTYWFEDGAQRVTFEREQIPENGRGSVLVHVEGKTPGGLHGATGWAADVREEEGSRAHLVPMALPRTAAYASWTASWRSSWVATKAGILIEHALASDELPDEFEVESDDDRADLDPEKLLATLKPEKDEESAAVEVPDGDNVPGRLREQLEGKGLSIASLRLTRALRVVGAREPFPRDFGLSLDVHPIWVFVTPDCDACDAATKWLDDQGLGYHAMLLSDPTNKKTLSALGAQAKIEKAAVPTLWMPGQLIRGFDKKVWSEELKP